MVGDFSVYFGILVFFLAVLLTDVKSTVRSFVDILDLGNFLQTDNLVPLITVAGTMFAYFSIVILSFGDFSRYVKDEKQLKLGNLSLILNLIIFSFLAVFIITGVDSFLNNDPQNLSKIFTNPTDMIGKLNNLLITIVALIFIIIASISTNLIANFIPSQYSVINFIPSSLSLKSSSYIIISLFGILIAIFWLTILSQIGILSIIDTFGAFFGPLFGVMVVDFYSLKKVVLLIKICIL